MEWQILGGEAIKRTEVEVEWGSLRMVKMRSQERWVVDWFWRLYNRAFESGGVPEDWRSAMIVPLYKGKGERTECSNYKSICLLNMVEKIYAWILVNRVHKMTKGLTDEKGRFKA